MRAGLLLGPLLLPYRRCSSSASRGAADRLAEFIASRKHLVLLTGAGISTSSGIPDYRSPDGSYSRGHKPMSHQDFVTSEKARSRYWSRSMLGWRTFSESQPTPAHRVFAQLEARDRLAFTITQNVDRLHQRAGAKNVLDLHGRNDRVRCLSCGYACSRRGIQLQLDQLNPLLAERFRLAPPSERLRADGDADVDFSGPLQVSVSLCIPSSSCSHRRRSLRARAAEECSSPRWCSSATACPPPRSD